MANVIARFRDINTGVMHLPGESFESDDASRVADLINRGLIDGETDPGKMNVAQLDALAAELGVEDYEGNKAAKLGLIKAHIEANA